MKSVRLILFITSALIVTFSCNSSSPESVTATSATEVQSPPDESSRPPQSIDTFIANMDKAVSVVSPLTEEQKMAITKVMESANFSNLTRLEQREARPGLRNTVSATILTAEQAEALDKYMAERKIRNQQNN